MAIAQLESPLFKSVLSATGAPNDSGKVYIYTVGGNNLTDQVTVWSDKAKTTPIAQPIVLDSAGEAEIWFDGTVDIKVDDSADTQQYTITGIVSSPTTTITGTYNLVQNGSFELDSDNDGAPDNWVLSPATNGSISISAASGSQVEGTNGLVFTGIDANGAGTATSAAFNVLSGAKYDVSYSLEASDADSLTIIKINWYTSNDTFVSTTTITSEGVSNPTSYTNYSKEVLAPSTATKATLVLTGVSNGGTTTASTTKFDSIGVYSSGFTRRVVVSGGAVGTITVSDLDFSDGQIIPIDIVLFGITGATTPYIYLSGDTTITNYRNTYTKNGVVGVSANNPLLAGGVLAGSTHKIKMEILTGTASQSAVISYTDSVFDGATAVDVIQGTIVHTTTGVVTSIQIDDFFSASNLNNGSKIEITG